MLAVLLLLAADPPTVRSLPTPATDRRSEYGDPVAFSADLKRVAVASGASVSVWDVASGERLSHIELPKAAGPTRLAFTADGAAVACAAGGDLIVRWFDCRTGRKVREQARPQDLDEHGRYYAAAAFGPGADWLLLISTFRNRRQMQVIDTATGRPLRDFPAAWGIGPTHGKLLTADGRVVVGSTEPPYTAQVWDVATGKLVRTLADTGRTVYSTRYVLAVSPDGRHLLLTDEIRTHPNHTVTYGVSVWGLADGRRLCSLVTPTIVRSAVFSADGRTALVSTGVQGPVSVLDFVTETVTRWPVARVQKHCRLESPDGKLLALFETEREIGDGPGTLHLTTFPTVAPPLPEGGDLDAAQVDEWWTALGSANDFRRRYAVAAFVARPEQAVVVASTRLRPEAAKSRAVVADLIRTLDDEQSETRDKAQAELAELAARFEPLLEAAHKAVGPGDVRNRLATLLNDARTRPPADLVSELAGVEMLSQIGTVEANAFLQKLAAGAADSRLTEAAKRSVKK